MSIGYYSQDDDGSPHFEEDPKNRLVCPDCDEDVLISEYGETWLCEGCYEEGQVKDLRCRESIEEMLSIINQEKR